MYSLWKWEQVALHLAWSSPTPTLEPVKDAQNAEKEQRTGWGWDTSCANKWR